MGEIVTDLGDRDVRTHLGRMSTSGGIRPWGAGAALHCEQMKDPARPLFWDPNNATLVGWCSGEAWLLMGGGFPVLVEVSIRFFRRIANNAGGLVRQARASFHRVVATKVVATS